MLLKLFVKGGLLFAGGMMAWIGLATFLDGVRLLHTGTELVAVLLGILILVAGALAVAVALSPLTRL